MTEISTAQVANAREDEEQQMSNENDEQNRAEVDLRTPEEWCQIERVQILDADGWRGRDGRPWIDPISLAEFQQRLATCTQRSIPLPAPNTRRLAPCVKNWPDCESGQYNPACCRFPKSCSCTSYNPDTINDEDLEPMTTPPAGEHHTGTLDLTGEGSAPEPQPLRNVIDYLTDAARRVNWKPDDKHPLQARYDALRSLMSIYAYATLVSLETLQRTDPGAADRVAEHLSHDDWDVRAECALLWHESLTGGARYAPFDEELHLLAGHHDPDLRQQVERAIAVLHRERHHFVACELAESSCAAWREAARDVEALRADGVLTEAADTKALVETATRLGRELGRREAAEENRVQAACGITDSAVTESAKAAHERETFSHQWSDGTCNDDEGDHGPSCKQGYLNRTRAALESAYPAIRQQVAEEIAAAIERVAAEDHGGDAYINADRAATIAREIGGVA